MALPRERMAAAVTVYQPDMLVLGRLLDALVASACRIYLYIDGPTGEAVTPEGLAVLGALPDVRILQASRNAGIAAGLNRLVDAAMVDGLERLVFFDQDSDIGPGLVAHLNTCIIALEAEGCRPAALGPVPIAAERSGTKAPAYRKTGARSGSMAEVAYVIISGCCIDLAAWRATGPFLESLRMDGVDLEWCFRAQARGYRIWCDEATAMPHRIGSGIIRLGPVAFPRQSEARMSNYVRSQAQLLRLDHVPLRWKIRSLIYVPLQAAVFALRAPGSFRTARRMVGALADGLRAGGRG